jgi:prepilin-type N-terminal cleavage/methylation domain-containing protein
MMKDESGFTLLELIIVLILSLLILGLVSVNFVGLSDSAKFQTAVRDFSTRLRQARILAKINGQPQKITINLESGEYGLEGQKLKKIPSQVAFKIVDPYEGEIRNGTYLLVLEPNGGGAGPIFEFSFRKKTVRVQIDPLRGAEIVEQQ